MIITNTDEAVGKTVKQIVRMIKPPYDDEGYLRIDFTDNSSLYLIASYGGYTGHSEDEYISRLSVGELYEVIHLKDVIK